MTAKLGGCPAKPLLLTLAILSCIGTLPLFKFDFSIVNLIFIICFLFNIFIIASVIKMNSKMLNISRYILLIELIVFCIIPSFIVPIFYASMGGAGLLGEVFNGTESGFNFPFQPSDSKTENFWIGFVFGLVLEIFHWLAGGVTYLMYVLATKLWKSEIENDKGLGGF